ncbi:MAG: FtsW/RodA/SpoVE family cell cycle protein [Myxococcota bacterium]
MKKSLRVFWSDPWLTWSCVLLTLFGVTMIYSTTTVHAMERYRDAFWYVKKHLLSLGIGVAGFVLMANLSLKRLYDWGPWIFLAVLGSLVLLLIPGFGVRAGGAVRWLKLGPLRIGQPAELAKLALVLFFARSLTQKQDRLDQFWTGYFPHLVVLGVLSILLLLQPDFGTLMLLGSLSMLMMFVAGVPLRYLLGVVITALPALYMVLIRSKYRWERITAFLDPFAPENVQHGAYQLVQSLKTIALGGLWGCGLGQSHQKLG